MALKGIQSIIHSVPSATSAIFVLSFVFIFLDSIVCSFAHHLFNFPYEASLHLDI